MGYCTRKDVYTFGVQVGTLPKPARLVTCVAASDTVSLDGHGFDTGDVVYFRAEAGGSLPSPLVEGTGYYVIASSDSTFQVSATSGGAAINLTTAGANVVVWMDHPWDDWIEAASRTLDDLCVAHQTPFTAPYPQVVIAATAALVAEMALGVTGGMTDAKRVQIDTAWKRFQDWKSGKPISDPKATGRANLSSYVAASSSVGAGWYATGGKIP